MMEDALLLVPVVAVGAGVAALVAAVRSAWAVGLEKDAAHEVESRVLVEVRSAPESEPSLAVANEGSSLPDKLAMRDARIQQLEEQNLQVEHRNQVLEHRNAELVAAVSFERERRSDEVRQRRTYVRRSEAGIRHGVA